MRLSPRTLKGQLTALFLLLTLVPSLLLTLAATRQLLSALERWENPSVQSALLGSLEVARDLMDRAKNDLRQRGQLLAADPTLGSLDAGAVRERLAAAYNVDFVQLYSPEGTLLFETTRDPLIPSPGRLSVDPGRREFMEDEDRGLLAYAGYRGDPAGPEQILVTGFYLDAEFFARLDNLSRAVTLYSQIAVLKRVNQRAVMLLVALVLVGLAVGSVAVARWLAGRVSRPVMDLGSGMERVTEGADGVRVVPSGPQEMEHVIGTFNAMSSELSRSRRELAQAERLAAWRDVARRVAHEMKNALTPITFSLHRLRKATPSLPEHERERVGTSLQTVMDEVEGLKRLAASFSELARLPVAELEPVDLGGVIEATVQGFPGESERIHYAPPAEPLVVRGDRTLLRQALGNLVRNAVEADAGRIWVRAERENDRARVTVEDEGPGWPEAEREVVLEPYFTTKSEGSGLGLSLVQRTLLQHGGSLHLDDRPGGGARVTLSLPLSQPGGAPRRAPAEEVP
jgi:nitrogen fixation/metabolism regulation signal transduction histidine kinase